MTPIDALALTLCRHFTPCQFCRDDAKRVVHHLGALGYAVTPVGTHVPQTALRADRNGAGPVDTTSHLYAALEPEEAAKQAPLFDQEHEPTVELPK